MTDRERMNKAILEVLLTTRKADHKDAFKLVETEYRTYKYEGRYIVINDHTNKSVSAYHGYKKTIRAYSYGTTVNKAIHDFNEVDFVGILEKPLNEYAYKEKYSRGFEKSESCYKWDSLRSAKWSIKYHKNSLAEEKRKLEKAMAEYERNVAYHTRSLIESTNKLSALRKEYGLIK